MNKKRIASFGSYVNSRRKTESIIKNKVNLRMIINECCADYNEVDDEGKLEMLRDVLLLLMKIVFGEDACHVEFGQGTVNNSNIKENKHVSKI